MNFPPKVRLSAVWCAAILFQLPRPGLAADATPAPAPLVIKSTDGYCEIRIDTAGAPELTEWAARKLAPVLADWYPKIVAMLPSDGFNAPKKFTVTLKPAEGVAYTLGTDIVANSAWLKGDLNPESIGSLVHEVVHVVQQYGSAPRHDHPAPGWLVEGIPDYIRFFKFEPQIHGADDIWVKKHPKIKFNYDGMYRISANFLNYVIEHYDPDKSLLQKVNAACREGVYTDDLWKQLTGKPLADLNQEWKASIALLLAPKTEEGAVPSADPKKNSDNQQ